MNKNSSLFDLLQNSAISSIALHSFTLGFNTVAKLRHKRCLNPKLEYMFYILPIVYNQDSMEIFKGSNELYTALIKNKEIVLGLQDRANKMSIQTFDSLNLAFSKKILQLNKSNNTIELSKGFQSKKLAIALSMNTNYNSIKKIQDSAYKLGSIFAKRNEKNIQLELNIRF
jgi:hypothetical protein